MNDRPSPSLETRVRTALHSLAATHAPDLDGHRTPNARLTTRPPTAPSRRGRWSLVAAVFVLVVSGLSALAVLGNRNLQQRSELVDQPPMSEPANDVGDTEMAPGRLPRRAPIVSISEIAAMRATIELTYLQAPAPCEVLDEATATETDDRVIITVIVASQPDDEQCPGAPVSHVTRVALDRPVGGRQVVDSTSGAEIPWARSQSQQLVQPLPPGFIATLDPPPMSPIAAREPVPDPLPSEEWALGREGERQVWVIDDDQLTGAVSVVDFAIPWERAIAGHSITTLGGVDAVIDEGRAVVVLRRDQGVRRVLGGEDGVPSGEPALLDAAIEVASALGDGPLDAPLPTGRLRSAIVATATSPVVTYGHTIEIQIVRFERRPTTDELRWSAARFARVNDATTFADQAYVVDMPSDRQMLVELVSPVDAVLLHTPGDADLHTLRPALQLSSLADSGLHIAAGPTSTENVAHGESEWGRWSIAHSEDRMCQKATVAEWTVGGLVPTISSSFDCVDAHPRSAATCQFLDPFRAVVVVVGLDSSTVTVSSDGLPIAATFEDGDGGVAALVTGLRADASLSIDADGTTIDC